MKRFHKILNVSKMNNFKQILNFPFTQICLHLILQASEKVHFSGLFVSRLFTSYTQTIKPLKINTLNKKSGIFLFTSCSSCSNLVKCLYSYSVNYGKSGTIFPEYVKGWVLFDPILHSFLQCIN